MHTHYRKNIFEFFFVAMKKLSAFFYSDILLNFMLRTNSKFNKKIIIDQ